MKGAKVDLYLRFFFAGSTNNYEAKNEFEHPA